MWVELAYSSACDIRPGTVRRDASNEHTFMSIRDMTLFGAFKGGFLHYRGGFFYREGVKSPLYRPPVNEDFTTEVRRRRRKIFSTCLNKTKNPIPQYSASKGSSALSPTARISPYCPSEVQSPNALCKDIWPRLVGLTGKNNAI